MRDGGARDLAAGAARPGCLRFVAAGGAAISWSAQIAPALRLPAHPQAAAQTHHGRLRFVMAGAAVLKTPARVSPVLRPGGGLLSRATV